MSTTYAPCHDRRDCFAKVITQTGGVCCLILNSTYPEGYACPFCKTNQDKRPIRPVEVPEAKVTAQLITWKTHMKHIERRKE